MKITDLIITANRNLFRNKTRTFLTILAIFIGSFTIILSNAINTGVNDFIDRQIESLGGDSFIEIAPAALSDQLESMMGGSSEPKEYNAEKSAGDSTVITDEDLEKIRAVDGIISAKPYKVATVEYITSDKTDKRYKLTVATMPTDSIHADLSAGRQTKAEADEREVMISEQFVTALGFDSNEKALGQTITFGVKQPIKCYIVSDPNDCLAETTATIVGIEAPSVMSVSGDARINNAAATALYDLYTVGVDETVKNRTSLVTAEIDPTKTEQIKADLEKLGFTTMSVADAATMVQSFFDVVLVVFNIFGAIALLAAAIGIINTLFMSVQERTREIGLMKAMGMSNNKIFLEFSCEAIMLGFWGSVIGILISMAIGYATNALAHQTFLEDFQTFNLVVFSPVNMLVITGIIMLIAFIAGTAPAYRASRRNPIDSLRYE